MLKDLDMGLWIECDKWGLYCARPSPFPGGIRYVPEAELASAKAERDRYREALEFYTVPRFISRDGGKTWKELVQANPHLFSEKENPDIQREVEFGTIAREALAAAAPEAAREGGE